MEDSQKPMGPLAMTCVAETLPQWLTVAAMLTLIFGGCCSNVFALEKIIKVDPASGAGYPHVHEHGGSWSGNAFLLDQPL